MSDPAGDVHRCRVATDEGTVVSASVSIDDSKAALLCGIPCVTHQRGVLHLPGTSSVIGMVLVALQVCLCATCRVGAVLTEHDSCLQAAFREGWSSSLMSAYYPLLLSGSSLVVCFWAEVSRALLCSNS